MWASFLWGLSTHPAVPASSLCRVLGNWVHLRGLGLRFWVLLLSSEEGTFSHQLGPGEPSSSAEEQVYPDLRRGCDHSAVRAEGRCGGGGELVTFTNEEIQFSALLAWDGGMEISNFRTLLNGNGHIDLSLWCFCAKPLYYAVSTLLCSVLFCCHFTVYGQIMSALV